MPLLHNLLIPVLYLSLPSGHHLSSGGSAPCPEAFKVLPYPMVPTTLKTEPFPPYDQEYPNPSLWDA